MSPVQFWLSASKYYPVNKPNTRTRESSRGRHPRKAPLGQEFEKQSRLRHHRRRMGSRRQHQEVGGCSLCRPSYEAVSGRVARPRSDNKTGRLFSPPHCTEGKRADCFHQGWTPALPCSIRRIGKNEHRLDWTSSMMGTESHCSTEVVLLGS